MHNIIKDHKDFLVINKHPGESFHKDNKSSGLTGVLKSEQCIKELYTVHRLDAMTSGILVFAKNTECARELSRQFQNKLVEKYYLAISDSRPKKKQGLIKGDMERTRRGGWKLTRTVKNPAITQFFSCSLEEGLRLFIVKPHTGKTHQIRVAMKSIGAPVLGDPLYHKKEDREPDRGYLHSYGLRFYLKEKLYEFVHIPDRGQHFKSEKFLCRIKNYEKPWKLKWPSI